MQLKKTWITLTVLAALLSLNGFGSEIFDALWSKDLEKVRALINKDPKLLREKSNQGSSLLVVAAFMGDKPMADFFIREGLDVAGTNNLGDSALHYAALGGYGEIIKLLLKHRTPVDLQDKRGQTPLHLAVLRGRTKAISLLLSAGSNIDAADGFGKTPLIIAVEKGYPSLATLFAKKGAKMDRRDNYGMTPLHYAALSGSLAAAATLLENNAPVSAIDKMGKTPLHYAAKYGHKKIAEKLKNKGAKEKGLEENYGFSPLLSTKMQKGEAYTWYLGHSGWAVKTRRHFLVFDYWKNTPPPDDPCLANGWIVPGEIKRQKVYVFVSHGHADHYDTRILAWEKSLKNITYIFGWQAKKGKNYINIGDNREKMKIGKMKLYTIHHKFDGIPESAFLVEVDGLTIYHSGDHGNGPPPLRKKYKANIDYLASLTETFDIIFLPIWGEEFYPLQKFSPKWMFPMHEGGSEYKYKEWAEKAVKKFPGTKICYPLHPGDSFHYKIKKGTIK